MNLINGMGLLDIRIIAAHVLLGGAALLILHVHHTNRPSNWQARFYEEDQALKRIGAHVDAAE